MKAQRGLRVTALALLCAVPLTACGGGSPSRPTGRGHPAQGQAAVTSTSLDRPLPCADYRAALSAATADPTAPTPAAGLTPADQRQLKLAKSNYAVLLKTAQQAAAAKGTRLDTAPLAARWKAFATRYVPTALAVAGC